MAMTKALWVLLLTGMALPAAADQWIAIGATPNPTSIVFYNKTELQWTSKTVFRAWIESIAQAELDKAVNKLAKKETDEIGHLIATYQSPNILLADQTLSLDQIVSTATYEFIATNKNLGPPRGQLFTEMNCADHSSRTLEIGTAKGSLRHVDQFDYPAPGSPLLNLIKMVCPTAP